VRRKAQILVELNGIEASRSPASGTRRAPLAGGPAGGPPEPQEVDGSILGFEEHSR
jgi:hypothetical protein